MTARAAVCAAATPVLNAAGRDFVRIVTSKDPRRNLGLRDDVALRLMPSRTGFGREASTDFWGLARRIFDALAPTRTVHAIKRASAALAARPPRDPQEAEDGMLAVASLDLMITNLGRVSFPSGGPFEMTAIPGDRDDRPPRGEQILGVTTYRGRLRMTNTTQDPFPGLLSAIAERLETAAGTVGETPVAR